MKARAEMHRILFCLFISFLLLILSPSQALARELELEKNTPGNQTNVELVVKILDGRSRKSISIIVKKQAPENHPDFLWFPPSGQSLIVSTPKTTVELGDTCGTSFTEDESSSCWIKIQQVN